MARRQAEAELAAGKPIPLAAPLVSGKMRMSKLKAKGRTWDSNRTDLEDVDLEGVLTGITHQVSLILPFSLSPFVFC